MNSLTLFLFPDICPEEEACVRSCVEELKKSISIREIKVTNQEKGFFQNYKTDEPCWIVSRDWQHALRYLSAFSTKSKIFVSVISSNTRKMSIWETWFKSLTPVIPAHIKLLAHSPLGYRFLKELAGMPDLQLEQIPLPAPIRPVEKRPSSFTVGAYCSFVSDNNLHFLLTVGHYLSKRDDSIRLNLWGEGPLADHLLKLADDLGVSNQVHIIPTAHFLEPESCDIALYFPQKNDHFAGLLMAASVGAVPICGNIPGIENYVTDSVNGFVFQQEEIRSIAELILTLKNHPALCRELGARFQRDTLKNFSSEKISDHFLSVLKGNVYQTQNYSRQTI